MKARDRRSRAFTTGENQRVGSGDEDHPRGQFYVYHIPTTLNSAIIRYHGNIFLKISDKEFDLISGVKEAFEQNNSQFFTFLSPTVAMVTVFEKKISQFFLFLE